MTYLTLRRKCNLGFIVYRFRSVKEGLENDKVTYQERTTGLQDFLIDVKEQLELGNFTFMIITKEKDV